jgi:hypothetical protein
MEISPKASPPDAFIGRPSGFPLEPVCVRSRTGKHSGMTVVRGEKKVIEEFEWWNSESNAVAITGTARLTLCFGIIMFDRH